MKLILLGAFLALGFPFPVQTVQRTTSLSCGPSRNSVQMLPPVDSDTDFVRKDLFRKAIRQTQENRRRAYAARYLANLKRHIEMAKGVEKHPSEK